MIKKFYLLLFSFLALSSFSMAQESVVASVAGKVEYILPNSNQALTPSAGLKLPVGTIIRTKDNGEVALVALPGAIISLKKNTELILLKMRPSSRPQEKSSGLVELKKGLISVLLNDENQIDFKIKTPEGVAQPTGTFYGVMVSEDKATVVVRDGKAGLEQFIDETAAEEENIRLPKKNIPNRYYGENTTTSPRS